MVGSDGHSRHRDRLLVFGDVADPLVDVVWVGCALPVLLPLSRNPIGATAEELSFEVQHISALGETGNLSDVKNAGTEQNVNQ